MKKKVFLIDDEKEILEVYQTILAKSFEVTCFDSPIGVIQALEAGERPDIFVTDMKMPGMTGMQLIHWAREHGIDQPFIIVSGYAERSEAFEVLKLGMIELLEKPFSMDFFRLMIQRALSYRVHQEFLKQAAVCAPQFDSFLTQCQEGVTPSSAVVLKLKGDLAALNAIGQQIESVSQLFNH